MSKELVRKTFLLIFMFLAFAVLFCGFIFHYFVLRDFSIEQEEGDCQNHIVILGTYENELFLKQVMEGAQNHCDDYNAVVEFYVPESLAEDVSLESLFEYAAFVNADGIIAYVQSATETVQNIQNIKGEEIPIITTGVFAPNMQMISYIGTSYWELGHKFGEEIINILEKAGTVYILGSDSSSNANFSNLTNAIQASLIRYPDIKYSIVDEISEEFIQKAVKENSGRLLFVSLTEEDTIQLAQYSTDLNLSKQNDISIIGFGTNETSLFYLSKGNIYELISLDPEKIGESALKELFEYKNHGYANSYMAADIKIVKAAK